MAKLNLTGTKLLIASGALAGTVGGWTALALAEGSGGVQDPAWTNLVNLPIPTLAQPGVAPAGPLADAGAPAGAQSAPQPTLRSVEPAAPPPAAVTGSSR